MVLLLCQGLHFPVAQWGLLFDLTGIVRVILRDDLVRQISACPYRLYRPYGLASTLDGILVPELSFLCASAI